MLYSKLFGKTKKSNKTYDSVNATYLQKGGFIDQVMAGVYTYLPLGLRVLNNIENIIRDEMNKIGNEVFMPSLAPQSVWEKTGRLETVDILMKTTPANKFAEAKNSAEYVLNPTHEEVVVPLGQRFILSYKDFPFALYQIQTKFRNEPRVKSGLLRGREFRMKDLYSFHTSVEDFKKYYEKSKEVYFKVFERLGLKNGTVIVLASGGSFTDDYSHEFQTFCETGEDVIFYAKSKNIYYNREIAPSIAPKVVEKTTKTLTFETDDARIISAIIAESYDINEDKLRKVVKCKTLKLVSKEIVQKVVGTEVKVFIDDSANNCSNFECETNTIFYDIKVAKEGDLFPETKEKYQVKKAAEVGNIFPLYTKFTDAFNYKFIDQDGKEKPIYMGCYGIGPSRIMGVIVEKCHDDRGIIWPKSVAPFQVHLIGLDLKDKTINSKAHEVYTTLEKNKVEVLFDDREEVSAGEKFADADLIGIPIRLVVSKRTGDKVEFKKRDKKEVELISLNEVLKKISK